MINYQSPPPFSPPPDAGVGAPVPPAPPAPPMPGPMSGPMPGMNGIPGAMGMPPAPYPVPQGPPDPASIQYLPETQQDGTVLLRIKNPDGSPGPVVQIVKPPGLNKKGGK